MKVFKKKAWSRNMVDSSFLAPAAQTLGLTHAQLSKALGFKINVLPKYLKLGQCPETMRLSVNGLLAEAKVLNRKKLLIEISTDDVRSLSKMVQGLNGVILFKEE